MLQDKLPWKKIGGYLEGTVEKTFGTIFNTLDGIEGEVKVLRDKDLQLSRDKLAQDLISDAAKQTAVIGGTAALPDILPTHWPALIPSICADFGLTLRAQTSMLLKLAYLYGPDLSREDRKKEVIGILASFGAPEEEDASSAVQVSKDMFRVGSKHLSSKALVMLGRKLGERFIRKKLLAVVPILGIAISGGVNYYGTQHLGDFAREYYRRRKFSDADSQTLSSEVRHFQDCLLLTLVNMAKVDRVVSPQEETYFKDQMMMFGYAPGEQEKWSGELKDVENVRNLSSEDIGKLAEDEKRFILKQAISMMYADREKSIQEANYLEVLRKRFSISNETLTRLEQEVKREMGIGD